MKKLISMCAFIDYQTEVIPFENSEACRFFVTRYNESNAMEDADYYYMITKNYCEFLQTPLELGMFVPCKDGELLEVPYEGLFETSNNLYAGWKCLHKEEGECVRYYNAPKFEKAKKEYQEAKSKVIFEGVEITEDKYYQTKRTFMNINKVRIATILEYYSGKTEVSFGFKKSNVEFLSNFKTNFILTDTKAKELCL